MAINPHDDYEALAKLLYPSIEASGNAYYGQTRKLTLDEVLKRNSLGFDSHVESFYENDSYNSYFCWRLGSLHGSIATNADLSNEVTIDDFPGINSITRILYASENEQVYDEDLVYTRDNSFIPIFGTIFAKYRIDKSTNEVTNLLHSGEYKSYETNLQPVFVGLYVTDDFNPVNSIDDNISDRHFYIAKEDSSYYLYIQILTSVDTNNVLTFTALDSEEINKISLHKGVNTSREVHYRINSGLWQSYIFDSGDIQSEEPTGSIELAAGDKIQFTSLSDYANFPNNLDEALRFSIDSGKFFVSGNCSSLIDTVRRIFFSLPQNGFYGLFYGVDHLYGTPILPSDKNLANSCYAFMFYECASLSVAPKLKEATLKERCYESMFGRCCSLVSPPQMRATSLAELSCREMFKGCTSLRSTPKLYADTLGAHLCYSNMFGDCKSLKRASCNAQKLAFHEINTDTLGWMNNVPSSGIFTKRKGSSFNWLSGINGIPSNWSVVEEDAEYFTAPQYLVRSSYCLDKCTSVDNCKCDYLVTSGMNSSINGRGDITDSDTITNMEDSFDERNRHQMNTYNADGSFNQEIWGYKSFNSPVQFRNGIYGEQYLVSECTSSADEIKAVVSDIQNYTSDPKVTIIEPDSVKSSCYKSNNTSVTLSSVELSDITATSSNTDIFNMYGVTPTVPEDDLRVAGSTQDSSNIVHISAATHTNKVSEVSINSKTFPIVYVDRDLDLETYPEYESNGIALYHNTHSEICIRSKADYTASILVSSRTSELDGDSISSIIMQSKSNHVPHLYSDIILPNCYVVVYKNAYRYNKRDFIVALSTVSNEQQEDVIAKVSSDNDIYLLPPGVSKQTVASSENKSVDELTFIECVCSDEQIASILHNHVVGYDIRPVNNSYIGTGVTPFKQIHTTELLADKVFGHMPNSSKLNQEMQYSTRLLYLDYTGVDQINYDEDNRVAPLTFEIIDKGSGEPTITIKTVPHSDVQYIPTRIKYAKISKTNVNIYNLQMYSYPSYAMGEIRGFDTGDIIRVWVDDDITNTSFHFNISFSYGMKVSVSGNPARLYKEYTDNWYGSIERDYCFKELFKRYTQTSIGGIIDASNLYLNNVSGVECCKSMFENNVNLEYPPVSLGCDGTRCCQYMFRNSGIIFSPVNYYGDGGSNAYDEMFSSCNNIKVGYIIYKDTTNSNVFLNVFKDCNNITDIVILGTRYSNFSTLTSTLINTLKLNSLSNKSCNIFGYTPNPNISNMQDKDIDSIINRPLNSGDIVSTLFGEEYALVVYTAKIRVTSNGNLSVQRGKLMAKKWILLSDSSSYFDENSSVSYIDNSIVLATAL